jgi:hypothetical protein
MGSAIQNRSRSLHIVSSQVSRGRPRTYHQKYLRPPGICSQLMASHDVVANLCKEHILHSQRVFRVPEATLSILVVELCEKGMSMYLGQS